MDYKKILDEKMGNMEMSPNKRKSRSVDALKNADRTKLSVDDVKKKYKSVEKKSEDSTVQPEKKEQAKNEDIDVKLIRNKDRSEDASDPVGERTIIFNSAEIGYELHPDHQGKGFMQEAIKAVMDFAYEVLELDCLVALFEPGNSASVKLLERNGFQHDRERKYAGADAPQSLTF